MSLVLVRHARAGERESWEGDDRLRPLDERGIEQAATLPALLESITIGRVVSSPYLRCIQTVTPLAKERRLAVDPAPELGEPLQATEGPSFLEALLADDAVACVHGGIERALGFDRPFRKGAVWLFEGSLESPTILR